MPLDLNDDQMLEIEAGEEVLFMGAIESPEFSALTSDQVTILCARLAARFAAYAADANRW